MILAMLLMQQLRCGLEAPEIARGLTWTLEVIVYEKRPLLGSHILY